MAAIAKRSCASSRRILSLSSEDGAILDELADAILKRRLGTAALFFLESMRPLSFVGSQMMVFFRPFVALVWANPLHWDGLQRVLEHRDGVEALARRLEAKM
ncbi:hypothetical protein BH11MYX1_BH11MYX1_52230 [soil metagenome]